MAERLRRLAGTLSAIIVVALCSSCSRVADRPLPASVPVVQVGMAEYAFLHQLRLSSGRVILSVENQGKIDHTFSIVRVSDESQTVPSGDSNDEQRRLFSTIARGFRQAPGEATTLAVDLPPGRYEFHCFLQDPDGSTHDTKGMSSAFIVEP